MHFSILNPWGFIESCIRLILLIIFILTIENSLYAQENYEIRQITFRGNKTLEEDFLLERMALDEVSWLEKFITKNEPHLFSRELVQLDLQRLIRIYQSEGFIQVKADYEIASVNDKKKIVKIRFIVDEGDPVTVNSVQLNVMEDLGNLDADSLFKKNLNQLELKEGNRFRDVALEEDIQTLQDAFKSMGFAYANVNYNLNLKPDSLVTTINYSAFPGPKSYFGETTISGNDYISKDFIRKQLTYEKGELYNKSELTETRNDMYRLQVFRVVSVLPQKNMETRQSSIPVEIYVEEAPRLTARVGAGYGTEDKFRTFIDLNYRGFLSGARRLNLYAKHSALEPYFVELRWIQPQFLGIDGSISLNPFIKRNDEPGYETRNYGINVPFKYIFTPSFQTNLSYYFEDVEQRVEPGDEDFPNYEHDKFPYIKSGLLLSAIFNNAQPIFNPERGIKASMGFKYNGHIFNSTFNYTRLWGEFSTYYDLGKIVLAYRIMAGGITSSDSSGFIPVEDRFYSGGSQSIRGWARQRLGPKRESGTPLGGKTIFESNLEARYHLFWRLGIAAFIEAGNVWRPSYDFYLNDLGYAAGGGLRLETPIGPVRLDLGVPLWTDQSGLQIFISVGQAF